MKMRCLAVVLVLAGLSPHAQAQPIAAQPIAQTALPPARVVENLGTSLPLDVPLTDSDGRRVRMADFFGDGRPALLVFGYYQCPQLCGLLMQGVLESLHDARPAADRVRILAVSIDPQDTPSTAHARRELDLDYARFLAQGEPDARLMEIHLFVADPTTVSRLTRAAGFEFTASAQQDPAGGARFAHPATVLVLTPAGRVSRYLMGLRFDAAQMRAALEGASAGRVAGLSDRLALLCAHVDPRWGQHSAAILGTFRVLGSLSAVMLLSWCWRRRQSDSESAR